MSEQKQSLGTTLLMGYYGLLQLAHVITLIWAGSVRLQSGQMPFPAQPPPGGWHPQAFPFLLGMGVLDAGAAGLGLYFIWHVLRGKQVDYRLGLISLTMALTSAGVFAAGTWAAGVWQLYPVSYFGMLILSLPVFPLFRVVFLRIRE